MEQHWAETLQLLEALPSSRQIWELPQQIGVDRQMLQNTFRCCKEVRARYTIFQMVWDLGLLEQLSDQVIEECFAEEEKTENGR